MRRRAVIIVSAVLAGCAARGLQSLPAGNANAPSAPLALRLVIPAPSATSSARPTYVSRNTQGVGISYGARPATFPPVTTPTNAYDVSASSSLCTTNPDGSRTCNIAIPAPLGTDDFQVTAWDSVPVSGSFLGGGNRLSGTTVLNQTITAGQANSLSFTLDGVVNGVGIFVTPSSLPAAVSGTVQTATLSVNATDLYGNIIIGSGTYRDPSGNPLTLTIRQAAAASGDVVRTTLSRNTINSSGANTVTVTYPGGSTYGTTFSATPSIPIAGISSGTTLTISPSVTEFAGGAYGVPGSITTGSDGNLWFTESGGAIARMTASGGGLTEFFVGRRPEGIAAGSDGNLWFTSSDGSGDIGRITPSGTVTYFSDNEGSANFPLAIAAGPDGNVWFTGYDSAGTAFIGGMQPYGLSIVERSGSSNGSQNPGITSGPDGNLWFTETNDGNVGRITPSAGYVVTHFSAGGAIQPYGITAGPDGNLWFTSLYSIGRITPTGTVTLFSSGMSSGAQPKGITAGPDGNLWFAENGFGLDRIGRITPSGTVTEYSTGISASSSPLGITVGPDGNLWFTEQASGKIGRLIY